MPAEKLAAIYAENLGKVFRHVSAPVIMRNTKAAPLYALFLASNNRIAVKITNDIFKRYEKVRVDDWLGRR